MNEWISDLKKQIAISCEFLYDQGPSWHPQMLVDLSRQWPISFTISVSGDQRLRLFNVGTLGSETPYFSQSDNDLHYLPPENSPRHTWLALNER